MSKSSKAESVSGSEPSGASPIGVAVLSDTDKDRRYAMYRVVELDGDGAFLGGRLLLERGEALTLELQFDEKTRATVKAEVIDVEDGDTPGIRVKFSGLSDANRLLLTKRRVKPD